MTLLTVDTNWVSQKVLMFLKVITIILDSECICIHNRKEIKKMLKLTLKVNQCRYQIRSSFFSRTKLNLILFFKIMKKNQSKN